MFKKLFLLVFFAGPVLGFFQVDFSHSWHHVSHESAHIAKSPSDISEAIVQIYQAKDFKWKGAASVRTWIATKDRRARSYTVYEIIGAHEGSGKPVLSVQRKSPDELWYGQAPRLIYELKGEEAYRAIPKIDQLARSYPFANKYEGWFGPNDNTFVAHVVRQVDEINFAMPHNAVGKDYLVDNPFFSRTPTKTGYQINYKGMIGLLISREEGVEINLGGLVIGVNPKRGELKLPGFSAFSIKNLNLIDTH